MQPFYSASQCIPWLVVLIIECLAIVILNIITIVVFVKKKRQLQRRSTYLIIHLAIVDLLVGVVSGPLQIELVIGRFCSLWKYRRKTIWSHYLSFAFLHLFSFISLTNLMAISLERLHAIFCPFRHRFVRKWVYRVIIIFIWLIAIVRETAQIFLWEIADLMVIDIYLYILFYAVSLIVICVSYILIVIKVRCSSHPQFHSRSKRERKLTGTALIVSVVSLLCFSTRDDIWSVSSPFLHLFYEFSYSYGCDIFIFRQFTCKSYNLLSSDARIQRRFITASLQGP